MPTESKTQDSRRGARSVLAVEAHPDDVELGCLGTLLCYRTERDARVTIASLTLGDRGSSVDASRSREEISEERKTEGTAVATELGAEFHFLGQGDCYTDDSPDSDAVEALTRLMREVRAELVIAPPSPDYHRDHVVANSIAEHACLLATVPTLFRDSEPLKTTPRLLLMDPITGLGADPSLYIDISAVFERKCELLRLHSSQMASMQKWGGWDLVDYAEIVGKFRGLQSGTQYAEAFTVARTWPRLHAEPALP